MLHIFRKNGTQEDAAGERLNGGVLVSHILLKFLKRLRHMDRPHLLDLGRVSGANIEFFARYGCRVRVEDLLFACAPGAPEEVTRDDQETATPKPATPSPIIFSDAPRAQTTVTTVIPSTTVAGARPSRRIVVPPRRFATTSHPAQRTALRPGPDAGAHATTGTQNALLPTRLSFPDETFDAIVAWDIFNYYQPSAMSLLSAETRRILKPGGLLFGYFHARRPEGSETPGRFRILDETKVACDSQAAPLLTRHVYQNRDIEKMFLGLTIVELYFLKNSTRELLMEKKTKSSAEPRSPSRPALPKPRFTIE